MDQDLSALTKTAITAVQLLVRVADADPLQGTMITMQAITFGNSRVNQVSRGLHVNTGE
ncbi:MAG: hypothetical protein M3460_23530 [Actinomycetota bacterium]|nr:hypothetical protein [Actinomycetota bacterium]